MASPTYSKTTTGTVNANPFTVTFTPNAGTNRVLLITVINNTTTSPHYGCTVDSVDVGCITHTRFSNGADDRTFYYLAVEPVGGWGATVAVAVYGPTASCYVAVNQFNGVNKTYPIEYIAGGYYDVSTADGNSVTFLLNPIHSNGLAVTSGTFMNAVTTVPSGFTSQSSYQYKTGDYHDLSIKTLSANTALTGLYYVGASNDRSGVMGLVLRSADTDPTAGGTTALVGLIG